MRRILAFFGLILVKYFSLIFYRGKYHWLTTHPEYPWDDIRLMVLLNHTSLYEPLFAQILPVKYLWRVAGHYTIPAADVTLDRPIVGTFWKLLIPNIVPISRKKDDTWENYLASIKPTDVVMILPEGRMKRPNGFDKFGNPMTVRGGVADIINRMEEGKMLLCFSGGLHHVQAPGQFFPHLFKSISMNLAYIDIQEYKSRFSPYPRERKMQMIRDLQERLLTDCPRTNK